MDSSILLANLSEPVPRLELIKKFCHGKTVLDLGCVQHDACNAVKTSWLHHAIAEVAVSVLGVDYRSEEVEKLNARGYNMIAADVTRPLALDTRFDVIVVGNLIEHLSNFEGLLVNIRSLLKPTGCALVSTGNPFFCEQYFYTALKNSILVNPEHTCWICPVTLDQLCRRFRLVTDKVYWVKEKWSLGQVILNGDVRKYNMFTGRWLFHKPPSFGEATISAVLWWIFRLFFPRSYVKRVFDKYQNETKRILYLRFVEKMFNAYWVLRRLFVVASPINRYELFVSVLRLDG